jgi:hypothetical protein
MQQTNGRSVWLEFSEACGHHDLVHRIEHGITKIRVEVSQDASRIRVDAAP